MFLKSPRRCKIFGQTFYFNTIRKYVILFGTLFNDVHIIRRNKAGAVTSVLKVPLTYGPKDKMLARVTADPNIDRQFAVQLPIMSFEMKSISYDGSRKLPTVNKVMAANSTTPNAISYQYNPVPYNINFELSIMVKNAEDGTKIIEQILPFFTPDWTSTIKLIPEMNVVMDIPIILNTVNLDDQYENDFKKRRSLTWTLTFTLKGYIYGPVKSSKIIKYANTNFYVATTDEIRSANTELLSHYNVHIQPGLTANGTPTGNASLSIPVSEITVSDDFGFVIDVNEVE